MLTLTLSEFLDKFIYNIILWFGRSQSFGQKANRFSYSHLLFLTEFYVRNEITSYPKAKIKYF